MTGLCCSSHASATCPAVAPCASATRATTPPGRVSSPARERKPGDEAHVVGGAIGQHVLAAAVDQVVAVLHRRHRKYPASGLDVGHRDLAQPRITDDAVVQQSTHGTELFVARHARVDAMKLPEVDLLDAELPETALGLRNQVGGVPVRGPLARPRTREARLGGDQQSAIGMKRLANQFLRYIGAVAVGRVDEVDAELGGRRSVASAACLSGGGPQTPGPVTRMAP